MKLNPMSDRVVVKRQKAEDMSKGGIIIPDAAKKKASRGEVLAVGPGKLLDNGQRVALDVKPGDLVVFGDYSGTEVKLHGEELVLVREDDILGVLES